MSSNERACVFEQEKHQGYDIIGDVHGCGKALARLLEKLNYKKHGGVYQYADQRRARQAIFVGDIVDRGPSIRKALHIVRDMVEHGSAQAVMGNHEFNAIKYCTRARPGSDREYLREHKSHQNRLIKETLEQFADYAEEWQSFLDWFMTLPIFLEFKSFRVVHACWDEALIQQYRERYREFSGGNHIDENFLHLSVNSSHFEHIFMRRLTCGVDLPLPEGMSITGKDGITRRKFRVKFWEKNPQSYKDIAFQPDPLPEALVGKTLDDGHKAKLLYYAREQKPLFVGHYWQSSIPAPVASNLACLDYSAVHNGRLVAYRMDGETELSADKFVWVDVN